MRKYILYLFIPIFISSLFLGKKLVFGATVPYQIQAGDTLSSIAQAFATNIKTLMTINTLHNPNQIIAGHILLVPSAITSLPKGAKALVSTLTAYTDGYQSTGKVPGDPGYGITADGAIATQGVTIAVDPSVIPLGTKVFIPGIGERIAQDTGGLIRGNRIDVFYRQEQTAIAFGVKPNQIVYILPNGVTTSKLMHFTPLHFVSRSMHHAIHPLSHPIKKQPIHFSDCLNAFTETLVMRFDALFSS